MNHPVIHSFIRSSSQLANHPTGQSHSQSNNPLHHSGSRASQKFSQSTMQSTSQSISYSSNQSVSQQTMHSACRLCDLDDEAETQQPEYIHGGVYGGSKHLLCLGILFKRQSTGHRLQRFHHSR